jgi:hypothetical protein
MINGKSNKTFGSETQERVRRNTRIIAVQSFKSSLNPVILNVEQYAVKPSKTGAQSIPKTRHGPVI